MSKKEYWTKRINKGMSYLNADSKKAYQLAVAAYYQEIGRVPSAARIQDLEHEFNLIASCYRAQKCTSVDTEFDAKTRTAREKGAHVVRSVKERAAIIRQAMADAKNKAIKSGKAVKVVLPKITFE